MARHGRLVVAAGRAVREIRRDLSARTKTLLERDVGGARFRHLGLQHLAVRSTKRPLAVPWIGRTRKRETKRSPDRQRAERDEKESND